MAEAAALAEQSDAGAELTSEAQARLSDAEHALQVSEARLAEAQAALSDLNARRNALGAALAEESRRLARFDEECATVERERVGPPGRRR